MSLDKGIDKFGAGLSLIVDPSKIVQLVSNPSTTKYDTFNQNNVAYVVPTGKILYIVAIEFNGTALGQCDLGYGDTNVSDDVAPTNYIAMIKGLQILLTNTNYTLNIFGKVPAGKYPCARNPTATGVLYCNAVGIVV